mmetsp:Transcript_39430/g.106429  ORF Transcript_39430/g.106429 Transcript_39430/m.106429 type:complete len:84 (+) Transcript_39430:290-541(+)
MGMTCCTYALKQPQVLVKGKSHCLFVKQAASFPFDSELVPSPICAVCCIQCMPNVGCAKPHVKVGGATAPSGGALVASIEMVR